MINPQKICIIMCVNNPLYLEECFLYLNRLVIPDGFEVDILTISDAKSMTSGYNEGLNASDAKYKIYMHQDVFIVNKEFISDILSVFQNNPEVGMLGVIGGVDLPQNALIADAWNVGKTYASNFAATFEVVYNFSPSREYTEVEAVDGMLMMTQYDLEWREDLDLKWDFYDISQSMEFRRKGYKVAIPRQNTPWCIHDCGHSKMICYDANREVFLKEYGDFFGERFSPFLNIEKMQLEEKLFDTLKMYMESGDVDEVCSVLDGFSEIKFRNTNIQYLFNFCEIYKEEKRLGVAKECQFINGERWEELVNKYNIIKFSLRRIENEICKDELIQVMIENINKTISCIAVYLIAIRACVDKKEIEKLLTIYKK